MERDKRDEQSDGTKKKLYETKEKKKKRARTIARERRDARKVDGKENGEEEDGQGPSRLLYIAGHPSVPIRLQYTRKSREDRARPLLLCVGPSNFSPLAPPYSRSVCETGRL